MNRRVDMASKIIILSGNGRGIARIYEMTHKIRLEMDAVVTEKNKRLGVMINDTIITYPYAGRQIAIDLKPEKIHKASVIVYSDGDCLLSGASNGKCDITELMYLMSRHDAEREYAVAEKNGVAEGMTEGITDNNALGDVFNAEIDNLESLMNTDETAIKVDVTDNVKDLFLDESAKNSVIAVTNKTQDIKKVELSDNGELRAESATPESVNKKVVVGKKGNDICEVSVEVIAAPTEIAEKQNGNDMRIYNSTLDDTVLSDNKKNLADTSNIKEHEVVTAMLEGKTEISNESLPLGTVPFYEKIWHKIEEMFDIYQHDSVLEDLVYDSAWIRIPYEDDGYYVVGVISDDGKPVFICYGIPQDKMTRPDKEIEDSCEWLPIDKTDVSGRGYWLVYQDAMTGENIS